MINKNSLHLINIFIIININIIIFIILKILYSDNYLFLIANVENFIKNSKIH